MPRKKLTVPEEPELDRILEEDTTLEAIPEDSIAAPGTAEAVVAPDTFASEQGSEPAESAAVPGVEPDVLPPETAVVPAEATEQPSETLEDDVGPFIEVEHVDLEAPVEEVESNADLERDVSPDTAESVEPPADTEPDPAPKSDRQRFYELDFHELDRDLSPEEQQEWNSIYASYRGQSALTGTIIGVDQHTVSVRNPETRALEQHTMYCAIVVPYRVRIVIPATEMWQPGTERPDFVMQNTVGATIDFVIIKVDREGGFAIGSRRRATSSRRYYFARRPALSRPGARLTCRVLAVGPRRCLVECYGHDLNLTQRELRYTAIPDLREVYHPGQELDCIVKAFEAESGSLQISVKETEPNPFLGAELRHPVGCRRKATIAGKYGGGVFCNLPDGTVCMCNYSHQHEDSDFMVGDTVILVVQRYEQTKQQMYGKIIAKW